MSRILVQWAITVTTLLVAAPFVAYVLYVIYGFSLVMAQDGARL
jgi:hypothetical protein